MFFILWNVGQGQWATFVSPQGCLHVDMGGEFIASQKIHSLCHSKVNQVLISHEDWDHFRFAKRQALDLCFLPPVPTPQKAWKQRFFATALRCEKPFKVNFWFPAKSHNSNAKSLVVLHKGILLPGDSPISREKIWVHHFKAHQPKIFVLGHHGSRTSNSERVLKKFSQLKMALVSARKAKYGHPHKTVVKRLKKYNIPLLKTEDWGNIWLEL